MPISENTDINSHNLQSHGSRNATRIVPLKSAGTDMEIRYDVPGDIVSSSPLSVIAW